MGYLPEHIAGLLILHLKGTISAEQQKEVEKWIVQNPHNKRVFERIQNKDTLTKELLKYENISKERAWNNLQKIIEDSTVEIEMKPGSRKIKKVITWWAAACLVAGLFYFFYNKVYLKEGNDKNTSTASLNIAPGKEGAILTLADGKQVSLDSLKNGYIEIQKGVKAKIVNGTLVYETETANPVYNTINTPKSRQYELILPDGTKVWLNSVSSIRFPTQFVGNERRVELHGEAYFEVYKNRNMPFKIVTKNKAEVVVLGTHFNINSYDNEENINTTLLEGSVNVLYSGQKVTLKPGQQAQISQLKRSNNFSGIKVANNVDVEKVTAWKNGTFNFEGMELKEIMRQLERWYDIEVKYDGTAPKLRFFGEISRKENLADVLTALEEAHVRFRLEEGRRLIVLAN
ncbi:FecR family protein [Pedobacter africanus]|uniref:FecR family protein n=1 Tax=Pedobacter africanus TaxID=151894 RepID=A0A1W1Z7L6_9SPHI|nr:FecR domain-containing protein [Pedobacter africanus]SMC44356.1 FecR family protein [Pedobacter africanus]